MTERPNIPATGPISTAQVAPVQRNILLFSGMASLLIIVGVLQSWNVAFSILNMCLISAIMALGVNIQWGYAGLFNVGVMGFAALGCLAGVVISMPPVDAAWAAGGLGVVIGHPPTPWPGIDWAHCAAGLLTSYDRKPALGNARSRLPAPIHRINGKRRRGGGPKRDARVARDRARHPT